MMDLFDEMIQQENFKEAIAIGEKVSNMYGKLNGYGAKVDTVGLSSVICALRLGDMVVAKEYLDKFDNFNSDAYLMAEKLVQAYESRDADALEAAKSDQGGKLALANPALFALRGIHLSAEEDNEAML